jgi:hypothetical protein
MTATVDTHPFVRDVGAAAWVCECGKSRNSSVHTGQRGTHPRRTGSPPPARTVAASYLQAGQLVVTTDVVGTDFDLPLVEPTRTHSGFVRSVRSRLRESGGTVVRFTDGTKTRPLNGHTVFIVVPPADADGERG